MRPIHSMLRMLGALAAAVLIGCSPETGHDAELESVSLAADGGSAEVLSELAQLEAALSWAEGKTPEAMVAELVNRSSHAEERYWKHQVLQAAFADAYGAELGRERLQAAYNDAYEGMRQDRPQAANLDTYYGPLKDYPEIYELAHSEPERALEAIKSVVATLEELDELRVEVLALYGVQQPKEAMDLIENLENFPSYEAQTQVIQAWARADPKAAITYVDQLAEKRAIYGLRARVLDIVVQSDPLLALRTALDGPVNRRSDYTLESIAEAYIRADPAAGYEWLMSQPSLDVVIAKAGIDSLANDHPEWALDILAALDPKLVQRASVSKVFKSLANKQPDQVFAALDTIQMASDTRIEATAAIFRSLAELYPDQFEASFDSISSYGISPMGFKAIAQAYAKSHPEKALRWASAHEDSPATAYVIGEAAKHLLSRDASQAAALLSMIEGGEGYRASVMNALVEGWARSDFDEAITWVQQDPNRPGLGKIINPLVREWYQKDPESARDFAEKLPPGEARKYLLNYYVGLNARYDLAEVVDFMNGLEPDKGWRSELYDAFKLGASVDPAQAQSLVTRVNDPQGRDEAIKGVAMSMMKVDPELVSDWLTAVSFHLPKNRNRAIQSVMIEWGKTNLSEAIEWTLKQTDSDVRDTAASRLLVRQISLDPTAATRLINALKVDGGRVGYTFQALKALPDQATREALVSAVFLTKDEQARLQSLRQRDGI